MNENLARLIPILSKSFKIAPEKIHPESRLAEDLRADSLDAGVALMDVEEEFGIIVPERERTYRTVGDILQHIEDLLREKQAAASSAPAPVVKAPVVNEPSEVPSEVNS